MLAIRYNSVAYFVQYIIKVLQNATIIKTTNHKFSTDLCFCRLCVLSAAFVFFIHGKKYWINTVEWIHTYNLFISNRDCSHNHFSCIFCLCTIAMDSKNCADKKVSCAKYVHIGHCPLASEQSEIIFYIYIKQWAMLMNLLNRIPLDACDTHSKYQWFVRHGFSTLSFGWGEQKKKSSKPNARLYNFFSK